MFVGKTRSLPLSGALEICSSLRLEIPTFLSFLDSAGKANQVPVL